MRRAFYAQDLAYIHDAGYREYALGAAPGLLEILRSHGIGGGLVVDLGCGSGRWARELNIAGYDVLGIDQSPDFLRLARRTAPRSRFVTGSLWSARLPRCDAVTSIGECINYGARHSPERLFSRLFRALRPGGVLVFDTAGPARIPRGEPRRTWSAGEDWAVLAESAGAGDSLTRRIISFRRVGQRFRRSEEIHRVQIYRPGDILKALRGAGFRASLLEAYGRFRLPHGIHGFLSVK